MQQPPSDRNDKNPYATPSAWPRAPQQTFHLRVPKAPPGAQAAKAPPSKPASKPAAPPRPAKSSILTGSALPVGYTAPQPMPEIEPFEVVEPVAPPAPVVEATPEPEPEVAPAPPFIAPSEAPFAAPRRKKRRENRAPVFIAAAVVVAAGLAGAAWLLLREPEATVEYEPVAVAPSAPVAREPVIVPPAFIGIAPESEAVEPDLRGAAEPVETAAVSRPAARTAPAASTSSLPSGPRPYSGTATPGSPSVAVQPLRIPPPPAPPPPASAPGPRTPVTDPDAPQTTRDPTSGD